MGQNSTEKVLKITGSGFESGISESDINFGVKSGSITIESVSWKSSTLIEVTVNVTTHCLTGDTTVYVENPLNGATTSYGAGGYFVIGAAPAISTITSPVIKEYGQTAATAGYPDKKFKIEIDTTQVEGVFLSGLL